MKIDRTFLTIVIVFMVIGSPLTYSGFSFAASTNGTQSQSIILLLLLLRLQRVDLIHVPTLTNISGIIHMAKLAQLER